MDNELIKDLLRESLLVKWVTLFCLIVSLLNIIGFVWIFHLVNNTL